MSPPLKIHSIEFRKLEIEAGKNCQKMVQTSGMYAPLIDGGGVRCVGSPNTPPNTPQIAHFL